MCQMNGVTRKLLEDAIAHLYGLSVRFITHSDEGEMEILRRPEYQ